MMRRLGIRLPIWAALAIVGAAYLARSVLIRDGDFALDLPADVIVLLGLVLVLVIVSRARAQASDPAEDEAPGERDREHDQS